MIVGGSMLPALWATDPLESLEIGWSVPRRRRLGCERGTLSRLLNGRAGVSAAMALALEDIGWGTAEHWMRMQASYELAQARRERAAAVQAAESGVA